MTIDADDEAAWDSDPNPEIVQWQPTHRPDTLVAHPVQLSPAGALGLVAVASTAFGALAVGALAIGVLAIGRLVIGHARIRRLEVDELVIGRVIRRD